MCSHLIESRIRKKVKLSAFLKIFFIYFLSLSKFSLQVRVFLTVLLSFCQLTENFAIGCIHYENSSIKLQDTEIKFKQETLKTKHQTERNNKYLSKASYLGNPKGRFQLVIFHKEADYDRLTHKQMFLCMKESE